MCRLMAYLGQPLLLADVVLWPDRSIIKQSYDARERKQDPTLPFHLGHGNLNGDGFGIGWFNTDDRRETDDPTPCVFTSITPAWNNENLSRLSCKIVSPLVFAHVRAAYPGMPVSEQNCHPFQWGRYMWMHNGVVGGFAQIRRSLLESMSDCAYNAIQSFHSDSAVSFALFLHHLPDIKGQQSPEVLLQAMQGAISFINAVQRKHNITATSLLNFVVSDGSTIVATRFVSPNTESPASLYYAEGSSFSRSSHDGMPDATAPPNSCHPCATPSGSSITQESGYELGFSTQGTQVVFVASEPITASSTDWVAVPKNTALIISREKGGFLNILHGPLTSPPPLSPQPSVSTALNTQIGACNGGSSNGLASLTIPPFYGAPPALPSPGSVTVDPQREVLLCLEALSRGKWAKSRAWISRTTSSMEPRVTDDMGLAGMSTRASFAGAHPPVPRGDSFSGSAGDQVGRDSSGASFCVPGMPFLSRTGSMDADDLDLMDYMRLTGHTQPIIAMIYDDEGQRLYTSSVDCAVKVWNLQDNSCVHTLYGQRKPVTAMLLRAEGRLLLATSGRKMRVWCTTSFRCLHLIKISDSCGTLRCMQVLGDKIYVGCQDTTVKVFPIDEAKLLAARALDSPATGNKAMPNTSHIDEFDHTTSDVSPDRVTDQNTGHVGPVNALAVCGDYLCSAGGDSTVRVWSAADLTLVRVLRGHRGSVLCLLGLGSLLLSGARDNTIRVWDLEMDMMCRRTLTGHKDDVTHLSSVTLTSRDPPAPCPGTVTPSVRGAYLACTVIASASADGTVRLWSVHWACLCILSLPGSSAVGLRPIPPVLCSSLSRTMAMAGYMDGEVRMWHCEDMYLSALRNTLNELMLVDALDKLTPDQNGTLPLPDELSGVNGGSDLPSPVASQGDSGDHSSELLSKLHPGAQFNRKAVPGFGSLHNSIDSALAILGGMSRDSEYGDDHEPSGTVEDDESPAPSRLQQIQEAGSVSPAEGGLLDQVGDLPDISGATIRPTLLHHASLSHMLVSQGSIGGSHHGISNSSSSQSLNLGLGLTRSSTPVLLPPATTSIAQPLAPSPLSVRSGFEAQRDASTSSTFSSAEDSDLNEPSIPFKRGLKLYGPKSGASATTRDGHLADGTCCVPLWEQQQQYQQLAEQQQQQQLQQQESVANGTGTSSSSNATREHSTSGPQRSDGSMLASSTANGLHASVPVHIHGRKSPLARLSPSLGGTFGLGEAVTAFGSVFNPPAIEVVSRLLERRMGPLSSVLAGGGCGSTDQQLEAALRDFVRIKTVSASPKLREDCLKGAKLIAKLLESLGADVKIVQVLEDKNPVVIGRLGNNPDCPTVTFYGHYDVQPGVEPDWKTNPFELNSVNEYLYGRGTSDNKGPILAFIFAVKELLNSLACEGTKGLPINVAFIFEGEEENGSRGFRQAVTQNLRWFEGTQLIVISNTVWVGENEPCLTYGMRGMLSLSIQISGPDRDLHSGNDGGVFAEPMVDLVAVMSTLVGPGGEIKVPGFYDNVEPGLIDLAWSSLEHSEEFSLEGYKAALGVPALTAPPNKHDLLVTRWCRPSLSVVDMRPSSGHAGATGAVADHLTCYRFGPTRFSVVPKTAEGKVSVRFVPNQDADVLVKCLRDHVQTEFAKLGSLNRIDVHVEARGNWWEAQPGSPWLKMAETAIRKEWGVDPLYVREGGTMPVASVLEKLLGAPAIMVPMGQSSDNCHLANERIRRSNLFRGKNVIRRLLEEVAARAPMSKPAAAPAQ